MLSDKNNLIKYCYDNKCSKEWIEHIKISHLNKKKLNITYINNGICIPDKNLSQECFSGGIFDE